MDDFLLEIRASFIEEANDLLNEFQEYLNNVEGEFSSEHIDNAFRIIHTIKGNGMACGYESLSKIIHDYEGYLSEIRQTGVKDNNGFIDKNMSLICEFFNILDLYKSKSEEEVDLKSLRAIVESIIEKPIHIAIIDDEPDLLSLQEVLLEQKYPKAKVSVFSDSEKAHDSIKNEKYDLIITDFNMPIIDGNQIIKTTRDSSESINYKTPIIMITAYKPPMFSEKNLHSNVFYVEKPFTQKSYYYYIHCAQKLSEL